MNEHQNVSPSEGAPTHTPNSAVSFIAVMKDFPSDPPVIAFDNLSFEIETHTFTAITGLSGSGKTTLLNLIAGLDFASEGQVIVLDTEPILLTEEELAEWRLANIGFVFQTYNLISTFTAQENLSFPLELQNPDLEPVDFVEAVSTMLSQVGLDDRGNHLPHQLSGGEQQRLSLARALITDPLIVLADEPTGNLDEKTARKIRGLLKDAHSQGKTVIVATHDPMIIKMADQIISLTDED